MLGLRQELTRLHFEGVNHRLLHQGLTHREGERKVREVSVERQTQRCGC